METAPSASVKACLPPEPCFFLVASALYTNAAYLREGYAACLGQLIWLRGGSGDGLRGGPTRDYRHTQSFWQLGRADARISPRHRQWLLECFSEVGGYAEAARGLRAGYAMP